MKNVYKYKINYTLGGSYFYNSDLYLIDDIKRMNPQELSQKLLRNYELNGIISVNLRNKLEDSEIKVLVDALLLLENDFIESLTLDISPTDVGATFIANLLNTKKAIKSFYLSGKEITGNGAAALANSLLNNTNIEIFRLTGTIFGDEGANAFSRILNTTSIKILDLKKNRIGNLGIISLSNILINNTTIIDLDLSINQFDAADELANVIRVNKTIINLHLYGNYLGNKRAEAIGKALIENNTLRKLDISMNNIGSDGAIALAIGLESNNTLTELHLWNNNIGSDGAIALAKSLESNNTLTALYLDENNIGSDGGSAFGKMLKVNKSLIKLHMDNNQIGDEGVIGLANGLKINNTLTALYLDENNIGDTGFSKLAEALSRNNTLTTLHISRNKITILPIDLALNEGITEFHYSDNEIENIHFLVVQWLEKFEEQQRIDQDSQNIHNHRIQLNTKRSYINIIKAVEEEENGVKPNVDEVISKISNHRSKELDCVGIGTISLRNFLIEKARNCTQEHGQIGLSFGKALWYVWKRIESLARKGLTSEEDIIGILCDEFINGVLGDNTDKCFTGGITRIINALNSIDPLVNINLQSDNERINLIVKKVYDNINDIYDEYIKNRTSSRELPKYEVFKDMAEKELENEGISITDEIISKFIIPLSDMIDENELENMLNDRRKSEKESVIVTDNMSRDFIKPTLVMTNDGDSVINEK